MKKKVKIKISIKSNFLQPTSIFSSSFTLVVIAIERWGQIWEIIWLITLIFNWFSYILNIYFDSYSKIHFAKIHYEKIHFAKLHLRKIHFAKLHFAKIHFGKLHFAKLHFRKTTLWRNTLCKNENTLWKSEEVWPTDLPTNQLTGVHRC